MSIQRLKSISIDDKNNAFIYNNDVMNRCFGENRTEKSGQYSTQPTHDGCQAWFPKERAWKHEEWVPGSNEVNWKNYLSHDGKIMISYLNEDENPKDNKPEDLQERYKKKFTATPYYTFMKSGKEPYKYVGTFIFDHNASTERCEYFRRIGTSIDLTNWHDQINLEYIITDNKPYLKNLYIDRNFSKQKKMVDSFLQNVDRIKDDEDYYLSAVEQITSQYSLSKLRFLDQEQFFTQYLRTLERLIETLFGYEENEDLFLNGMIFPDIGFEYSRLLRNSDQNKAIRGFAGGQSLAGKILALYNPDRYLYSLSEEETRFYVDKLKLEPVLEDDITELHCLLYFWKQCNDNMHDWSAYKYYRFLVESFPNPFSRIMQDENRMEMIEPDGNALMDAMKWFAKKVITEQNNSNIDFTSGYLDYCEGYKRDLWDVANEKLQTEAWDESMIGSGLILECLLDALNTKSKRSTDSIVDFHDIASLRNRAEDDLEKAESIIYRMYKNDNPEEPFDEACAFWGKLFPVFSYMMFLKDKNQYVPVKTNNHKNRFEKLGIDSSFLNDCTWSNFCKFNHIHQTVRQQLEDYLGTDVSLLDAHSFIWMLWEKSEDCEIVNEEDKEVDPVVQIKDPLENIVIKGEKEGRIVEHYVTKYERNPKNRADAIRLHGYTCMVCGFNYEKTYGPIGKDFIEVHHVKPLYSLDEEVIINPEKDLVCLCANCHRMIHKKRGAVLTVDELKEIVLRQKTILD